MEVKAAIEFDSIRAYFGETLHIDIRRSTYRGMQAWRWPGNYVIEFALDGSLLKVEYTDEQRWKRFSLNCKSSRSMGSELFAAGRKRAK